MKKTITMYAAIIICACIITLTSCSESPVDKQLDKIDALLTKFDMVSKEDNPSFAEITRLKTDALELQQSMLTMPDYNLNSPELTEMQKKRLLEIGMKAQNLRYNQIFQRIQNER